MTRASSNSPPPPAWTPASPTSRRSSSRSPASSTASPTTTSTTSGWCRKASDRQRVPRRHHPLQRLVGRRRQGRQVAHLPAGPRGGLAVEVELDLGKAAGGGPVGLAVLPEAAQE